MNVVNLKDTIYKNMLKSLDVFIKDMKEKAKDYTNISWEEDVWVINKKSIKFTKLSENHYHNKKMDAEFIAFAKAYIIHEYPLQKNKLQHLIATLRCIEFVLYKNNDCRNICHVNYAILDEIITFVREKYSNNYAYGIGRQLDEIILFLCSSKLTYKNIRGWSNPIKFEQDYFLNNEEKHNRKLLNDEILYFLLIFLAKI